MRDSKPLAVFTVLIAINIFWGVNFAVAKLALRDLSPFTFTVSRVALALVLMLPFGLRAGLIPALRKHGVRRFMLSAVLGLIAAQTGFALALKVAPAALIALVGALGPIIIAGLAMLLLQEQMALLGWAGVGLSLAGAVVALGIAPSELGVSGLAALLGTAAFLAGNLCWACYNIVSKRLVADTEPVALATATLLFGWCGLLLPYGGERLAGVSTHWSLPAAIGVSYGGFVTFAGFLGLNWALKRTEGAKAGVFYYIQPVAGVLASWLLLHERPGTGFLVGAVLIAAGILLTTIARIRTAASSHTRILSAPALPE